MQKIKANELRLSSEKCDNENDTYEKINLMMETI